MPPLDKAANADAKRRRLAPTPSADPTGPSTTQPGLPPLLEKYIRDYAATGRPPAYLPKSPSDLESSS